MKKVILFLTVILMLCGCKEKAVQNKITLTAENVSEVGLTLIIEYSPAQTQVLQFDSGYKLKVLEKGKYKDVPYIIDEDKVPQTLELYQLSPGESIKQDINWEYSYGKLEKGDYRIYKTFGKEKFYGEFRIK